MLYRPKSKFELMQHVRMKQKHRKINKEYKKMRQERKKMAKEMEKLKAEKADVKKEKVEIERLKQAEDKVGAKLVQHRENMIVRDHAFKKSIPREMAHAELRKSAFERQISQAKLMRKDETAIRKMSVGMPIHRIRPARAITIDRLAQKIAYSRDKLASLNKQEVILYNEIMKNPSDRKILNRRYDEIRERGY